MSSKFESGIRQIDAPQEKVYETLSNLQNLERVKDRIPDDKLQNLVFDNDSIGIEMAPIGKIAMRIVEREEPNTIKFESVESPMAFNFWIQLLPVTDESCKMKLTIKADMNPFVKMVVEKPLREGIEKMADMLQAVKYG